MPVAKHPSVLITGCSKDTIGHALALSFSSKGYHVFVTARRLSAMSSLTIDPNITLLELDITSPSSIKNAHAAVSIATSGHLDILYNNAGVRHLAMSIDTTYEIASSTMAANFNGPVEMVRVFSDLILASRGKIIFTSSTAGRVQVPTQAVYGASKAVLDLYLATLRLEMQPLGVQIVNVITGDIETGMGKQVLESLTDDSPYKSIENKLNDLWTRDRPLMSVTDYADYVVSKVVVNNSPKELWRGSQADKIWLIHFMRLGWLLPVILNRDFGLNKL